MRIPIRPTARRRARAAARPALPRRSGRNYRWSSSAKACAKGVFDPFDPMSPIRQAFDRQHVEARGEIPPMLLASKKILCGANDLALLGPRDRAQGAAVLSALALAHLDDDEHAVVETDQIELAGLATQIARKNFKSAHLQVLRSKLLGGRAALRAQILHAASCRAA